MLVHVTFQVQYSWVLISDTWKPSDDEVKYFLPRTGNISSSLTDNFQIEREKCAHMEDLNEALTSKYA